VVIGDVARTDGAVPGNWPGTNIILQRAEVGWRI
jgi:hypothetical protein